MKIFFTIGKTIEYEDFEMFKERFLELMKINNVKNYKSVSESTNIPMSTISHWLHESKNPNMDNLIALANLFDVTIGRQRSCL